ncbi:MAG: repair protein RecO protein [Parcubacteria group bacterium GW2011_GWC2_39_14]|nr:MAG: repair protein RecO protein [Parcubacteria group bacterium GW2011_GWC2_39_14]KKR55493.1 MAG: repair protein RecO protein [Parcubacteria group bacterium GW2011_GWA2_40_23]
MDKAFKTEAIVLTKKNWRENDLLFSFYTKDFGKIEAVVTGARRSKSKLIGPLSSVGLIEILFVKGKVQNKITHTYLLSPWPFKTLEEFHFLLAVREIIARFVQVGVPSKPLWQLLKWFSEKLVASENNETKRLLLNIFMIRSLQILGYDLKTDNCVQCELPINSVRRFSFNHKGFVCTKCHGGDMNTSQKMFETIKKIQNQDFIKELSIDKSSNKELFIFLKKYLQYFLEREVRSLSLI